VPNSSDPIPASLQSLVERRWLICTACRSPLTYRDDAVWLAGILAGQQVTTPATRPAGTSATTPTAGLGCTSPDCRRVYLVWEGIPNMLAPEAAQLAPA